MAHRREQQNHLALPVTCQRHREMNFLSKSMNIYSIFSADITEVPRVVLQPLQSISGVRSLKGRVSAQTFTYYINDGSGRASKIITTPIDGADRAVDLNITPVIRERVCQRGE